MSVENSPRAVRWQHLLIVFAVALLFRLIILWICVGQNGGDFLLSATVDTQNYVGMAAGWADDLSFDHRAYTQFGPGYGVFAGTIMMLFGEQGLPIALVQVLLASLTCVLVYLIAVRLGLSEGASLTAGLLLAVSTTPAALASLILSDTLYHFLFALHLWLFLLVLEKRNWPLVIATGLILGAAVLTRPIGQFWPLGLLLLALLWRKPRRSVVIRSAVVVAVTILTLVPWLIHNKRVHDIPALAMTSAGGPASIAALTLAEMEGRDRNTIIAEWHELYKLRNNTDRISRRQQYDLMLENARDVFRLFPGAVVSQYLTVCWDNFVSVNYFHRTMYPQSQSTLRPIEGFIQRSGLRYAPAILAALGLLILIFRRRWRSVLVLAITFGYCFISTGAYPWQGSRLFLPGQTATSILIAVALVGLGSLALRIFKKRARPARLSAANRSVVRQN